MILVMSVISVVLFASVMHIAMVAIAAGARRWEADRNVLLESWSQRSGQPPIMRGLMVACAYIAPWNRSERLKRYRERLAKDIAAAGDPWRMSSEEIVAAAELAGVGVTLAVWVLTALAFGSLQILFGLGCGVIAALTPGYLIGQQGITRRIYINRQLPFALDLLILTMEAGSSFLESIQTFVASNPDTPLAEEFHYMLRAIELAKTRKAALIEMAERVQSEDLTPIVQAINTGEELGTPIGIVLRAQSEGIRLKRTQRAEKLAAEASSKILFPTLLIMVAVLLMLMGPVIIKALHDGWF